jgi:hypothetical protein
MGRPAQDAAAQSLGCDLLVKGAYTQSRLRQMVFGGTTRHILGHATLPLIMANPRISSGTPRHSEVHPATSLWGIRYKLSLSQGWQPARGGWPSFHMRYFVSPVL